jgi:superfamily II DNA or RNA helicase
MNSPQRIEVVSNIIQEITSFDLDEPIISFDEQESTIDAQFSDGISIVSILDNIYDSQLSQIPDLKYLSYLEDENVIRYLDEERINFILSEHINKLWYSVLNNKLDVENAIKDYSFEGKYPQIIIQTFLKEYEEVMNFELPEGWTYPHEPLLMQKLVAYRISQRKRYGNWSSIGSGKTISAILAGRYVGAKNTLVITFNATIGKENNSGWTKEIKESFRDSNIFTKEDKNIKFIDGEYNYLVLNYEAFQQATSSDFVLELLKNNRFDYIVLDEVQSIKKRGAFTSKRRKVIKDDLIQKVRENNPDYYLLAMTATPVINNLMEVDSIIQLIEPNNVENIGLAENTINYLNMYRKLTNYGIRYKNENDSILKENQYTLLDIKADELYSQATLINSDNPSAQDKLTINAKLEAILPYINTSFGKTTLWTYHVDGIVETAKEFLTERGFKVGIYTGEESEKTREKVLDDYKRGDIDVLIASRVLGTGLDGLQKVCDTWVFLSLPFTNAVFVQSYGRIDRRGSNFIETGVNVVVPIVSINGMAHSFRWDYDRYMLINHKKNVSDAVVDGINPDEKLLSKEKAISHANESISDFIQIIKNEEEIEIKTHYRL